MQEIGKKQQEQQTQWRQQGWQKKEEEGGNSFGTAKKKPLGLLPSMQTAEPPQSGKKG